MLKRILIFVLIAAMLSLSSCKVVEVIDHGTTAPEETTAPQKEYEPWGFWCSNESLSAIQLTEGSNKATIYSLTPGYYEYDSATETDCTYDGNATFTIVAEDETFTFTFDKYANTLSMSDATFVHVDAAPTEHPKFAFPDYEKLAPGTVTVGDIDYASLAATVLEGARYEIATAFYGDMKYFSKLESVSRPVQSGDVVNINYCGKLDGVAFEGGKGEGYNLKLGSKSFIPGFEEQVAGHNVDEEFTIEVKFPEDYHAEDLKGADATFNVKIHAIKTEIVPELDDEFAKDVSEFDTLDELKADVRAKQQERADKDNKAGFENETVRAVCDNCEIDIPESMIQNEVEQMAQDQAARMSSQGIGLDMYLQYVGQTMDDFKKSLEPMARVRVKSSLVIEKITEKIDPEVTDEEYNEELSTIANSYKMDLEEVKKSIGDDSAFIKDSIKARKTVEYLASKAVKVEPKPAEEAKEEPAEEAKTEE